MLMADMSTSGKLKIVGEEKSLFKFHDIKKIKATMVRAANKMCAN